MNNSRKVINKPESILLGKGVFRIDDQLIGATQGGGKFTVTREFRSTQIDGAPGRIKGLDFIESAGATMEISHLELINDDIKLRHPGLTVENTNGKTTIKGNMEVTDSDYHTVEFIGLTKDGREVILKIENAINMENIDFELKEKSEVIDKCTFTASFPIDFENEPWSITWVTEKEI